MAGAPAGKSPGANSAGAAPPGRAACHRAGAAGRAAAEHEPAREACGISTGAVKTPSCMEPEKVWVQKKSPAKLSQQIEDGLE